MYKVRDVLLVNKNELKKYLIYKTYSSNASAMNLRTFIDFTAKLWTIWASWCSNSSCGESSLSFSCIISGVFLNNNLTIKVTKNIIHYNYTGSSRINLSYFRVWQQTPLGARTSVGLLYVCVCFVFSENVFYLQNTATSHIFLKYQN